MDNQLRLDWRGILKILEIEHIRKGEVIWSDKNLYNTLHSGGEYFILKTCFANPNDGTFPPEYYYLGLDNRTTIDVTDNMSSLIDEPSGNGYFRQPVSSRLSQSTGWGVQSETGYSKVLSSIVSFNAAGGSWGPVTSLFLTNKSNNTGYLIASTLLSNEAYLEDGDVINLRFGLSLRDYPLS